MNRVVLFIDPVCPKPYDPNTFATEGMGGTESTVIRVSTGLADTKCFGVFVEQHNRRESDIYNCTPDGHGIVYSPMGTVNQAHYVIVLRDPRALSEAKRRFPKAKVYLWCHDLPTPALGRELETIKQAKGVIAVSMWHRIQIIETLRAFGYDGQPPVLTLFNPIEDDLKPDDTPMDRNKLIFISSPHKGLEHALSLFGSLLRFNPDFKYYIANPGYLPNFAKSHPNVISLGSLPYNEIIAQLRSSLCLFFPNTTFPETFGRVIAEANAVGTPVLTHGIGATREVSDRPDQEIVDCGDVKSVVDRVMAWYNGDRPTVRGKRDYRLSCVIRDWIKKVLN